VKGVLDVLGSTSALVTRYSIDEGFDAGHYFNFTFETEHLKELWAVIQSRVLVNDAAATPLAKASIIACEGNNGWNDYLLLFHFDPFSATRFD